jgi:cytochrome c551/c552
LCFGPDYNPVTVAWHPVSLTISRNLQMMNKSILAACSFFAVVSFTSKTAITSEFQTTGKEIFITNCGSCHHPTRDMTGPTIYAVRSRWKDKNLLYKYVRNAQDVVKKDPYAKALFKKWNGAVMTPFPKLTNTEIESILDYVDGEAKKKGLL